MKKTLLMMAMVVSMNVQAANLTQDLGTIVQGTTFQATHTNETFIDTYNLTVAPNVGIGAAAINFTLDGASRTNFTSGSLKNLTTNSLVDFTISNNENSGGGAITSKIIANFGTLAAGAYQLVIGGVATLGTSSYNGNWTTIVAPSAVPVPAAVWLFGSSLLGMIGFSKRKKDVL